MKLLDMLTPPTRTTDEAIHSPSTPLLLGLMALVIWFGFQSYQLLQEQGNLNAAQASQDATYATARKLRAQLDALATGTARLAQQGNANAGQIVNALKARGVSLNASPAQAPASGG